MPVFPELGLDRRCRPRSGPRLPHFSFNERRRSGRGYFGGSRSHRGVCMACLEHWASTDRRRSKVMTSLDNFFAVFTRSNQADPTGARVVRSNTRSSIINCWRLAFLFGLERGGLSELLLLSLIRSHKLYLTSLTSTAPSAPH